MSWSESDIDSDQDCPTQNQMMSLIDFTNIYSIIYTTKVNLLALKKSIEEQSNMPNQKDYIQGLNLQTSRLNGALVMMEDMYKENYPIEPRLDTFLETNTGLNQFKEQKIADSRVTEIKLEPIKTDLYTPHNDWCFTSFNDEEMNIIKDHHTINYCIIAKEICPSTGRDHYQGYIETIKPTRLITLKKIFKTTHFEPRKGTRDEAIKYCKKDGIILYETAN